jgi:hypothetical protein
MKIVDEIRKSHGKAIKRPTPLVTSVQLQLYQIQLLEEIRDRLPAPPVKAKHPPAKPRGKAKKKPAKK